MDSKESLRIYIAVDPAKVARCKWCGGTESKNWTGDNMSGIYCSDECRFADQSNCILLFFVISMPLALVISGPAGLFLFSVLLSPMLVCGGIGQYHRRTIAKDSRRKDVSIDTAMLQAVSSAVLCPKCDANIDVTKVGDDRVYTCDYCGASGTIEVVKTS